MPAVTIRDLSEETHRALELKAQRHQHSTEAEIRDILETSVHPSTRIGLGTALSELSRKAGLTNADIEAIERERTEQPAQPIPLT